MLCHKWRFGGRAFQNFGEMFEMRSVYVLIEGNIQRSFWCSSPVSRLKFFIKIFRRLVLFPFLKIEFLKAQ